MNTARPTVSMAPPAPVMASLTEPADHPYAVLGFDTSEVDVLSLTAREIASAYRRAALRHHPDKNPGDAGAAAALARVFLAHEALSDEVSRAAVDDAVRAARARAVEARAMDAGRRQLRAELEQRERASEHRRCEASLGGDVEARLQREIERLRVEHGLGGSAAGAHAEAAGKAGRRRSGDGRRDAGGEESRAASAWERVPGYQQWKSGAIDFDVLEAAVLARARGEMPTKSDANG